jgi:hypothetical protein
MTINRILNKTESGFTFVDCGYFPTNLSLPIPTYSYSADNKRAFGTNAANALIN